MKYTLDNDCTLTDELLGEVTIALLRSGGPVTTSAVLEQLTLMAANSQDQEKIEACLQTINEVKLSINKYTQLQQNPSEKSGKLFQRSMTKGYLTSETKH